MAEHIFTGFGFGPIQAGLFAKEAFQSGNFSRIVIAEIDRRLVDAARANNGSCYVNVAGDDGIETLKIDNAALRDGLFTELGFRDYAEDLLERMTNPHLADTIARAGRDIIRKLAPNDRIFGTMQLALEYGIEPKNMAIGALAGIAVLIKKAEEYNLPGDLRLDDWRKLDVPEIERILNRLWNGQTCRYTAKLIKYVLDGREHLKALIGE